MSGDRVVLHAADVAHTSDDGMTAQIYNTVERCSSIARHRMRWVQPPPVLTCMNVSLLCDEDYIIIPSYC